MERRDVMKCPVCGATVKEGGSFCPECGTKVEESAQDAYVTPETVFSASLSEKEQLAQDEEAYKTAEAEYKRARERLGKSYAPMVALIVVVWLLGCAASAGGMYFYLQAHPQNDATVERLATSKEEVESLKTRLKAAKAKATSGKADETGSSSAAGAAGDVSAASSSGASTIDTTDPISYRAAGDAHQR